jgi:hypothetical protein
MPRSLATRPEQRQGANEVGCAVSRDQPAEKTAQAQGCIGGCIRGRNRAATRKAGRPLSFCVRVARRPCTPPRGGATARPRLELRPSLIRSRWTRPTPGGPALSLPGIFSLPSLGATSRPPLPRRWQLMDTRALAGAKGIVGEIAAAGSPVRSVGTHRSFAGRAPRTIKGWRGHDSYGAPSRAC